MTAEIQDDARGLRYLKAVLVREQDLVENEVIGLGLNRQQNTWPCNLIRMRRALGSTSQSRRGAMSTKSRSLSRSRRFKPIRATRTAKQNQ